jgi:hypothetical protein
MTEFRVSDDLSNPVPVNECVFAQCGVNYKKALKPMAMRESFDGLGKLRRK